MAHQPSPVESMVMHSSFWRDRAVFLTGHTGFKGSWLALWLQSLGARVTGFALAPNTQPNLFEAAHVADGMTSIIGDIRDAAALQQAMQQAQPEVVLHLAAQPLVRASYVDPLGTYATNVMGTAHLLEAVRQTASVRAVVNVTTDKVYENREWHWGYREVDALGGYDPYSNSKACSELVTASYRQSFFSPDQYEKHGVALATARAGNVIGGGDWATDRLIPDIVRAITVGEEVIVRNPYAIRPWQHVIEPLCGYLTLAEGLINQGPVLGRAWNFGPSDADAQPVGKLVEQLCSYWQAPWRIAQDEHAPHEAHFLKLDCSLAHAELGWQPRWNLKQALEQTCHWYDGFQQTQDARTLCLTQLAHYNTCLPQS